MIVGNLKTFHKKCLIDNQGLTLLEIMTVIAILGILAAISVPNVIAWQQTAKLRGATRDLMSDLSMARMHAVKNGAVVKALFKKSGYILFIDTNNDDVAGAGDDVLRSKKYPPGNVMQKATFPGAKTAFYPSGAASPAGSVTLDHGGSMQMKIIVNLVGRIRVQAT